MRDFNRNVGGNVRDGITGLGGSLMSKPREFAHLIKNKFGSADNINQLSSSEFFWRKKIYLECCKKNYQCFSFKQFSITRN